MLLDLSFATVLFTLPLEGPEPNAVKGFGVEATRCGKSLPSTVGVRLRHKVTVGDSHGRKPCRYPQSFAGNDVMTECRVWSNPIDRRTL